MRRLLHHVRSQVVAYVALFVALGGTGYAAVNLPANSVGTRQLKRGAVGTNQLRNGAVTPVKLSGGLIAGYVRAYATVNGQGQLVAARPSARLIGWVAEGPAPGGLIQFSQPIASSCFALATSEGGPDATYASAQLSGGSSHPAGVLVNLAAPNATGNATVPAVHVAVVCP
jgi:hypothetical protein